MLILCDKTNRMMNNIKISILVPVYNVEKYVGRCVESLFTQTYQNIEYVFVNDSTPDRSAEVIKHILTGMVLPINAK